MKGSASLVCYGNAPDGENLIFFSDESMLVKLSRPLCSKPLLMNY